MSGGRRVWDLLRLLRSHPAEAADRIRDFSGLEIERFRGKRAPQHYSSVATLDEALRLLSSAAGRDLGPILAEPELATLERHVARATSELRSRAALPIPLSYSADAVLLRLAYAACRALQPEAVLETGVAYGVTSAAVLAALQKNGKGALHSIDLPPLGSGAMPWLVGYVIPAELRERWRLHVGSSRRVMPRLLARRGLRVGVFIHDSADSYGIQQLELRGVWPCLTPPFAVVVNGIHSTPAFTEFVDGKRLERWCALGRTANPGYLVGLAVSGSAGAAR